MPYLSKEPKIIIAGGGIGGLVTALALHAAGFTNIDIFEATSKLTTLGVGINVQPSAVLVRRTHLCNSARHEDSDRPVDTSQPWPS